MDNEPANEFSTFESLENLRFADVMNLEEIQRLQDLFSDAFGVASLITNPDGTPITEPSNFCRLCNNIIRKTEKGCAHCYQSDVAVGRYSPSGPIVQKCLSGGLWDAGASITVGGKHIANWLIGQVRNDELNEQQMLAYADEIEADKKEFMEALSEVPIMSVVQFQKVSNLLFAFANQLSEKAYNNLQLKKEIAEREWASKLLQESKEWLTITLHSIGDGVISTDNNGWIVNMNPVAENLCGYKLAEATGKPLSEIFQIINSETRDKIDNPVIKVLESGKVIGLANHTILVSKDGTEYQIADSAAPIKNKEGGVNGVVLVFSDVTKKHEAESKLRESEWGLKESQKIAGLGSYRLDFKTGFWTSSEVMDLIFGIDETYQKSIEGWLEIIHPDWQERMNQYLKKEIIESHKRFDIVYKIIRKNDNQERWVHGLGELSFDKETNLSHMHGTIQDITERRKAENQLKLLSRAVEQSPVTIVITNTEGNIEYVNPKFTEVTGYSLDEVKNKNPRVLKSGKQPLGFYQNLWNTILSGKDWKGEFQNKKKNGDSYWESAVISPLINSKGDISNFIAIKEDITEKKKMLEELIEAKEHAEESDKLKTAFLNNISHEIRTPFNGILGFLSLIQDEDLPEDEKYEYINIINQSADRLMNTINDIVEIAQIQAGQIKLTITETNISKLANELFNKYKSDAEIKGVRFILNNKLSGADSFINTDAIKINTMLIYLIKNAIKFTTSGSIEFNILKDNDCMAFSIEDTGIGIPESKQQLIFERFTQANISRIRQFEGTGLGLSIAKAYVEMMGGKLWVESEEGKGSTFSFTIPYN